MGELPRLRIRLLGGLSVDGLDEREIGSRKGRTVLKVLALARGAAVPPDRIAEVLWGERLPSRPIDQVGVLVSRLRAVLGAERLPRTDTGYVLRADWLDVDELQARLAEAERRRAAGQPGAACAAVRAGLVLVRGPLLPGDEGEWVDLERDVTDRLVRRARLLLAEAGVEAGDHDAAVAAAEAVLAEDPYDESALRAVMRAHAAAGRPGSALAFYTRARQRLADDLGIAPSPETEALHDAVVLGEEPRAEPGPVAPPRVALAGREREMAVLAEVLEQVMAEDSRLLVVEGEAGIGKTALLDAAAAVAGEHGFFVVRCQADALGRDLPLQPVLDGLAAALRSAGPESSSAVLGPDAPVLEPLLGWRSSAGAPSATVLSDPDIGRARLFASLLSSFERLAGGRPLAVVIDDLHVADAATVQWLGFAVRRGPNLAVLAAARPEHGPLPPDARTVELGPLDVEAAALIVGPDRAADLHARSGGNPLFLVELARSGDSVPTTVRDAVIGRAEAALGTETASALRMAAVLGPELDLDVLAAVLGRPVSSLLADAEAAVGAGLLAERGTSYAFGHELVREALAAGTTAARRAFLHREAAAVLALRPGSDARTVAWHARQGGDLRGAAAALGRAAVEAALRYDFEEAERLLDEAVALADGAEVRLARARARMAQWDLTTAAEDAERALSLDAGPVAFEVAGWVAYYRRDFEGAQRYADEGARRADDEAVRASCLALAGRTRHARGQLSEAEPRLVEAATCHQPEVRNVAQVWLSALRAHQGRAGDARELAERALLEPARFGHVFARFHGQFGRGLALGMQGRSHELLAAAERMEADAVTAGSHGRRFVPVAMNLRSWALRTAGRLPEAIEVLRGAVELSSGPDVVFAEPRHVAVLDLTETLLLAGELDAASTELERLGPVLESWNGTMAWRAKQRLGLLAARLRLCAGDTSGAEEAALAVVEAAEAVGSSRHALLARCVAAQAADAAGRPVDVAAVDDVLGKLEGCAGLEAWHVTAQLAAACGVDRWWHDADRRAATLVAAAGPLAGDARRYVGGSLEQLRQRGR
ncbi:MAG TPA: BTAD domain-containing putative transcriptional regulator [Acidimicrobiales bacterium]|nr:BTAD domain-containing putative transcriptional regulator [Acidimicrobiales bacterium]